MIPKSVDIVFHLELNQWKGKDKIQLNIIDIRGHSDIVSFNYRNRRYSCKEFGTDRIKIKNEIGEEYISSDITKEKDLAKEKYLKMLFSISKVALGLEN